MSDNETQDEGDLLLDTDEPDAATDAASDTSEAEETSDSEQEQESLDLDDPVEVKTPKKGEEQKLKQIKTWQKKIDDGKVTVEDLPPNLEWMKEFISIKQETDVSAVRKVIEEERNEIKFRDIRDQLEDSGLSAEQTSTLNARYKSFRSKGLSKLDSIQAAMEIAQVDLKQDARTERRKKMKLPKRGGKSNSKDYAHMLETLPFSEAEKLIPAKVLDKMLRESVSHSFQTPG